MLSTSSLLPNKVQNVLYTLFLEDNKSALYYNGAILVNEKPTSSTLVLPSCSIQHFTTRRHCVQVWIYL